MSTFNAIHTDSELLRDFHQGDDQGAFRALVERYQAMVFGTAYRRTQDVELARDVAQEVFATLARKARSLLSRASLGGWLHQVATFQAAHVMQAEKRRAARQERFSIETGLLEDPIVAADAHAAEKVGIVDEALYLLSPADREAIVLHYFQDLSYAEMAASMGATEPAVRQRVSRALERLGKGLRERGMATHVLALLAGAMAIQSAQAVPAGLAQAALAAAGGGTMLTSLFALTSSVKFELAAAVVAVAGVSMVGSMGESTRRDPPARVVASIANAAQPSASVTGTSFSATAASSRPTATLGAVLGEDASAAATLEATRTAGGANFGFGVPRASRQADARMAAVTGGAKSKLPSPPPGRVKPRSAAPGQHGQIDPGVTLIGNLPLNPSTPLGQIAQQGGLPAVVQELQQSELFPDRAAALYSDLLTDLLSLNLGQHLDVQNLLQTHFEDLNSKGLAGLPLAGGLLGSATPEQTQGQVAAVDTVVKQVGQVLETVPVAPVVTEEVLGLVKTVLPAAEDGGLQVKVPNVLQPSSAKPLVEVKLPLKLPLLK